MNHPGRSFSDTSADPIASRFTTRDFDWEAIWLSCERRIRTWRKPPRWSSSEWLDELRGEAAIASLLAIQAYKPELNVPFSAYVRMRIMGQVLTRYRKEWSYSLRETASSQIEDQSTEPPPQWQTLIEDEVQHALADLSPEDRSLIERLFWNEESEASIGRAIGVSQQAVNKRKRAILKSVGSQLRRSRADS